MTLTKKSKISLLVMIDILIITTIYILNFCAVNYIESTAIEWRSIILLIPGVIFIYIVSLALFKMYETSLSIIGIYEIINLLAASFIANILVTFLLTSFNGIEYLFTSVNICIGITLLIIVERVGFTLLSRFYEIFNRKNNKEKENVLVIGAGYCGKSVILEILKEKSKEFNIIGIVDDNPNKYNTFLNGVKVIGNRGDIEAIVKENNIKTILFSIAKIDAITKLEILNVCKKTSANIKVIPGIYELIDGKVTLEKMKDIELKDLLEREEIVLEKKGIIDFIENKTILVTGGGGSIGSELCRQLVQFKPKRLLILDIYENNVYDLENELGRSYPTLNKEIIIASIRDKWRLEQIFEEYKPDIVFHAAAHKHVPLMESNASEAIKNNVIGTLNLVKCADKYNVSKFVQISTDKAVNPTNIMGATKRICEMIVQAMNKESKTEFVAVRFGNVLGSNGSVIPLFRNQIKSGGPITLTHSEITRYFMLIPEAAQLVIQAGTYAKGGEIFVLDMGKPVKIYDLAENLIRQSGFIPNKDIEIKITGLRPGEKLYEELLVNKDILKRTNNKKIFIDNKEEFDLETLTKDIEILLNIAKKDNKEAIIEKIKDMVPTFVHNENRVEDEIAVTK